MKAVYCVILKEVWHITYKVISKYKDLLGYLGYRATGNNVYLPIFCDSVGSGDEVIRRESLSISFMSCFPYHLV